MRYITVFLFCLLVSACKKDNVQSDFRDKFIGNYNSIYCVFSYSPGNQTENCSSAMSVINISKGKNDSALIFESDTFTYTYSDNDKTRFWDQRCGGNQTCLIDVYSNDSIFIVRAAGGISSGGGERWYGNKN